MRVLLALVVAGLLVGTAQASEWCGFHQKENARVHCGYSSLAECKQKLGDQAKDVTCMPDPSFG